MLAGGGGGGCGGFYRKEQDIHVDVTIVMMLLRFDAVMFYTPLGSRVLQECDGRSGYM